MKPKLKPHGTKRLKLNCGILLSNVAFKCILRCYTKDTKSMTPMPQVPNFTVFFVPR